MLKNVRARFLCFQHDYLEMVHQKFIQFGDKVDLCVPSGNFGNILSALFSKDMDVPYDRIICASNRDHS